MTLSLFLKQNWRKIMQKLHSIATISNAAMPSDLKSYLVQKMENIEKPITVTWVISFL